MEKFRKSSSMTCIRKNVRQCTNEEIYNALLIYTKEPALRKRLSGRKEENLLHFRRVPDR